MTEQDPQQRIDFEIELRQSDLVDHVEGGEGPEVLDLGLPCRGSVPEGSVKLVHDVDPSLLDESLDPAEQDRRLEEELIEPIVLGVTAYCDARDIVLLVDPRELVVQALMAPEATDVQWARWEEFRGERHREVAIEACLAVIDAAALPDEELGARWGVTVCPERGVLLRLNVGNRALLDVHRSGSADLCVLVGGADDPLPAELTTRPGFSRVEGSTVVELEANEVPALVAGDGIRSGVAAHARHSWRRLPNSNWHNPLVEMALFSSDLAGGPEVRYHQEFSSGGDGTDALDACEEAAWP